MATGRHFSISGINSGHHYLPTYQILMISDNDEFLQPIFFAHIIIIIILLSFFATWTCPRQISWTTRQNFMKLGGVIDIHLEVININVRNFNFPIGFYIKPHPLWAPFTTKLKTLGPTRNLSRSCWCVLYGVKFVNLSRPIQRNICERFRFNQVCSLWEKAFSHFFPICLRRAWR
jgi:hypothetical protein